MTKDTTPLAGIAQGLNSTGQFGGDYCDLGGSGIVNGMLGQSNKWKKDVNSEFESTYTGQRGVATPKNVPGSSKAPHRSSMRSHLSTAATATLSLTRSSQRKAYTVL